MRLIYKAAILTGATAGIGRSTAVLFAKEGANVVIVGRRENEGEETVKMVKQTGEIRGILGLDIRFEDLTKSEEE